MLVARRTEGEPHPDALLTGCSMHLSRCAAARAGRDSSGAATRLGARRRALAHAVAAHPELFIDKTVFSMDWYYPVLGGCLTGAAATERLKRSWDTFVVPGLGIRCVSDEPWVTGAETCELAIAMHLAGDSEGAVRMVQEIQHLRRDDGRYWTGWQFVAAVNWPEETTLWTAAAVVLAVDILRGGVTESVFRGDELPQGLLYESPTGSTCTCGRPLSEV